MSKSIKVINGALLLSFMRVSIRVLGLISTIVLARILVPEDFGLVAIALTYVAVITGVTTFNVNAALIHITSKSNDYFNTAWSISIIRGIVLAFILFLSSFIMDNFFDDERLTSIIWAISLLPLIDSCINPKFVVFEKSLDFSKEVKLQIITKITGVIITIFFAIITKSYWSLIIGLIFTSILKTFFSYILLRYKPHFTLSKWREFLSYTGWLTAASALNSITMQIDNFIIAKYFGTKFIGFYHIANQVSMMFTTEVSMSLSRAVFPALSDIKNDQKTLDLAVIKSISLISLITLPVAIGFAIISNEFILIVYGEKWIDAASIIHFIVPTLALSAMFSIGASLAKAVGKTRQLFFRDLIYFLFRVPALIISTYFFGMRGFIDAYIASGFVFLVLNGMLVISNTNLSIFQLIKSVMRPVISCVLMAIVVMLFSENVTTYHSKETLVLLKVLIGSITYITSTIFLQLFSKEKNTAELFVYNFIKLKISTYAGKNK